MTYAAEPYAIFVEDLLGNLTGAVSRVRFTFVDEQAPFELGVDAHADPGSVRVHGLAGGTFRQFVPDTDFVIADGAIQWIEESPGVPGPSATWPDRGSDFWAGFEREPGHGEPPRLTDRNTGSITRTLAESMAMEFAVIAHQLQAVYEGAYLETAAGRDLDQVAALVGVTRRGQLHASGAVTFRRSSPAAADITIASGTIVSSADPPLIAAETTESATLRRGTLAVTVPVRSLEEGPAGVAAARTLTVLHRPILGIEEVVNTQALTFGGRAESDEELRSRAGRVLESSGRSTTGAIRGALASLDAIREQDILVEEDHLAFPGVIKVAIATPPDEPLDEATAIAASRLLEEHRPAGIRIVHDLPAPTAGVPVVGETEEGGGGEGPIAPGTVENDVSYPIAIRAVVTPNSAELTQVERSALAEDVIAAIRAHVDSIGVGQPVVYNRIVAEVMSLDGVLDIVLDIAPAAAGEEPIGRVNLRPPSTTRPSLADDELEVTLGGSLVALDVTVQIERLGASATADQASALQAARSDIADRLRNGLLTPPAVITPASLQGILTDTADYRVITLSYTAELLEEGLLVERSDVPLDMAGAQQPWVRQVVATDSGAST